MSSAFLERKALWTTIHFPLLGLREKEGKGGGWVEFRDDEEEVEDMSREDVGEKGGEEVKTMRKEEMGEKIGKEVKKKGR